MSAIKPIIREVKQSVLKGFAHAKDKLHQLADNITKHVDDVAVRVRGQDKFDNPNGNGGSGNGPDTDRPGDGDAPAPRNDGRDDRGRFVGDGNRPWVDREQIGLDNVANREGVDVIRDQVASRHPSTGDQIRYYDGLFANADGTYTGIEVKSGSASRNPAQTLFDGAVSVETPAIANLPNVGQISIVQVILERVP
ncbi:hypothetical protein ABS642_11675 [Microbacterium sp. A8/3-1]|uniref:Uncharacterized protein n=1 Tax=Microbacterium sp. A8/3-1 TaxID=3160749 RepID=A0AAU7VSM5_9MICO